MSPLLVIVVVVLVVAFGTKSFLRSLGVLLKTAAGAAAAAILVALVWQACILVRHFEMPDCRSGQTYVAELDVCKGLDISQNELVELASRLPDDASDEDVNRAVAAYQEPTRLDRLWSQVLDWNRRRRQQAARQSTPRPLQR
jgi:hypothetical protein